MSSVTSEDGDSVSVLIAVDEVDGLLDAVLPHNNHNWREDLLVIAGHTNISVVDDGCAQEVALLVSWDLDASAVEEDLASVAL